jgi:hypothetical protein
LLCLGELLMFNVLHKGWHAFAEMSYSMHICFSRPTPAVALLLHCHMQEWRRSQAPTCSSTCKMRTATRAAPRAAHARDTAVQVGSQPACSTSCACVRCWSMRVAGHADTTTALILHALDLSTTAAAGTAKYNLNSTNSFALVSLGMT